MTARGRLLAAPPPNNSRVVCGPCVCGPVWYVVCVDLYGMFLRGETVCCLSTRMRVTGVWLLLAGLGLCVCRHRCVWGCSAWLCVLPACRLFRTPCNQFRSDATSSRGATSFDVTPQWWFDVMYNHFVVVPDACGEAVLLDTQLARWSAGWVCRVTSTCCGVVLVGWAYSH